MRRRGEGRSEPAFKEWGRDRRIEISLLVMVTAVGAALRLWRLSEVPPGLFQDEAFNGLDALRVLDGYHPLFFPSNAGREPLHIYLQALGIGMLGPTLAALRAASAVVGILTLPAMYWLGRELFGAPSEWKGRAIGLIAAAAMATSYWHLSFSRLGFRGILLIPDLFFTLHPSYFTLPTPDP